jgi:hypothetical protein
MDAAHPLVPIAETASEAHLEKRQYESHGATWASDEANSETNDPYVF